jgi:hypothetical protein
MGMGRTLTIVVGMLVMMVVIMGMIMRVMMIRLLTFNLGLTFTATTDSTHNTSSKK